MEELKAAGYADNTLVIYTSDNGIPFPNGRTNVYDSGLQEPMFISSPIHKERRNQITYSLASQLDIVPTLLDWFNIRKDENDVERRDILTGRSLLPLLIEGKADLNILFL